MKTTITKPIFEIIALGVQLERNCWSQFVYSWTGSLIVTENDNTRGDFLREYCQNECRQHDSGGDAGLYTRSSPSDVAAALNSMNIRCPPDHCHLAKHLVWGEFQSYCRELLISDAPNSVFQCGALTAVCPLLPPIVVLSRPLAQLPNRITQTKSSIFSLSSLLAHNVALLASKYRRPGS